MFLFKSICSESEDRREGSLANKATSCHLSGDSILSEGHCRQRRHIRRRGVDCRPQEPDGGNPLTEPLLL